MDQGVEDTLEGQLSQVGLGPECKAHEGIHSYVEWVVEVKVTA